MKRMKTKVVDGKGRIQAENKLLITSDKPFSCDTCGKAFAESGALTTHLRVHSGDKPYSCDTCGKAFAQSCHLTTHLRVHSGDKPYSCDTCGKAFASSSALSTHLQAFDRAAAS